ncbi:MAG TPA: nucleoside monophosphate kinase [Chloroflexota bacterium]|nr:nucleoside monophosphate kinase [Chloroflexota bacterium]
MRTATVALHLILMGPPQAGKGTQAKLLAARFGLVHLATGDLLRTISQADTALGHRVGDLLQRGEYVPDELVTQLVVERMDDHDILLDGYPRTLTQAETLEQRAISIHRVFVLDVPEQELINRAEDRVFCPNCGAVYGSRTNPPREPGICDVCGHGLAHRVDDAPKTVHHRLRVYQQRSEPVVHFYEARSLVQRIDGSGPVSKVAEALAEATAVMQKAQPR